MVAARAHMGNLYWGVASQVQNRCMTDKDPFNALARAPAALQQIEQQQDIIKMIQAQAHRKANPVVSIAENLKKYVIDFEAQLDADHEVALRIASFGGVIFFHAETIGFANPDLVTFIGVTDEGERVQLVQHYTQLSFLLKAVKKLQPEARRIGFL